MNLIEKVVIKDGVNADVEKTINLYSGQVAEINAILATISNTRGVAAYSVNNNKARFIFAGVGDNEMYIQMDGVVFKAGGLTSIDVDQSIKVIPYTVSETYTLIPEDDNKIIVVNNNSNVSLLELTTLTLGKSVLIQNDRNVLIECVKVFGSVEKFIEIKPYESAYVYIKDDLLKYHNYIKRTNQNRNLLKTLPESSTSITLADSTFENNYDDVTVVIANSEDSILSITEWTTIGREIKIINCGEGTTTLTLPSGHLPLYSSLPSTITVGGGFSIFMVEAGKWVWYR